MPQWPDWKLPASLPGGLRGGAHPSIDRRSAERGSYYFERRHGLIHRHVEAMALDPDQSGRWQLTIDLELPSDKAAICGKQGGERLYLFPLVFLRKSEWDAGFSVQREDGATIPFPTREQNALVSSIAVAHAGRQLLGSGNSLTPSVSSLQPLFHRIASGPPYDASVILDKLLRDLRRQRGRLPDAWEETGFAGALRLLVEHSLTWAILRGRPGQHRLLTVGHEFELQPVPVVRWRFGSVKESNKYRKLDTGEKLYGRRGRRISFSAIGLRLGQPLAWMPIEFDFPTIYTKRCGSYHFELLCPPGLGPRGLKVITDGNRPSNVPREEDPKSKPDARTTLKARAAHHYRKGDDEAGDVGFRVTVGVGGGAFPILWTLAASVTALLLWTMAATNPHLHSSKSEIAAGILLVVPALLGAIVLSTEHEAVTRLIAGARILLLVAGLSAVAGAAVLIGATPFGLSTSWSWTAYAVLATAVTVPLATSWLLSLPTVWEQMTKLKTWGAHYKALVVGIAMATAAIAVLIPLDAAPGVRIVAGAYLLLTSVGLTLLANNRLAIQIGETRRFAASALFAAALICFALACTELRAAIHYDEGFQTKAEWAAIALLVLSPLVAGALSLVTGLFRPRSDERHVSAKVFEDLIDKRRVGELASLRQSEPKISLSGQASGVS
jgi:hypothetical protein